jgi:hypothetical protein
MTGAIGVINPSTLSPFYFESGPGVFGKKIGAYPPTDGFKYISVAGTTAGTTTGRTVTIPSGLLNWSGARSRSFPNFSNVALTFKTFMSVQQGAQFMPGAGALADCPGGDGCNGSVISWCAPPTQPTATPAPGTPGNRIGNWSCATYGSGTRGTFANVRIQIQPGANKFGGTFSLLRNTDSNVWRVLVQPGTQGTPAEVTRSYMDLMSKAWTGGRPNFQYTPNSSNMGPRLLAALNANGAITQTYGCVNQATDATPGGTFVPFKDGGAPIIGLGNNCGTDFSANPPGQGWGFKMTTGTIAGSDFYPFLDATTMLGTPFAPNFQYRSFGDGFFFTRRGTDTVMGSSRNLVLVGGGVAADPTSGNSFFRITDLRMTLETPEPTMGLGLAAGAIGLLLVARRRRTQD